MRIQSALVIGGVPMGRQVRDLMNGLDVLVATPGRLLDLMRQNGVRLNQVEVLVLDEADRMLDMGFIHDIRTIVAKLPKERQTLLFSATMPREIADLAAHMLRDPARVAVTPVASTAERVEQRVILVDKPAKPSLLAEVLRDRSDRPGAGLHPHQARRRQGRTRTAPTPAFRPKPSMATSRRTSASACSRHSARASSRRWSRPISRHAASTSTGISHVINYDLPNIPESYVHRIGRTARAGAAGVAISFCDHEERAYLRDIEKLIQMTHPVDRSSYGAACGRPAGEASPPAAKRGPARAWPQRTAAAAQRAKPERTEPQRSESQRQARAARAQRIVSTSRAARRRAHSGRRDRAPG